MEPGQSMKVKLSPRKETSATLSETLMPWSRASGLASPTVDLSATLAGSVDGTGAGEDGFEKRGLAAEIGSNECDAAGAGAPIGSRS